MAPLLMEDRQSQRELGFSRSELLEQLERIVTSSHFRNSKRYPSFLRFIVERTVEENTEVLKERNLGTEVFGRPSDYDTGADPIVRVTAGEVRKRIAQYYQMAGHENELRIDLPLGSYVPHFYPGGHAPLTSHEFVEPDHLTSQMDAPPHHGTTAAEASGASGDESSASIKPEKIRQPWNAGRKLTVAGIALLLILGLAAGSFLLTEKIQVRSEEVGARYFWQPLIGNGNPALIVIGVHFSDGSGRALPADPGATARHDDRQSALASMVSSDMVPVSDVVSYSKFTDLLTRRSIRYTTKGSADTTLEELRTGPVILIGGFDNVWTMRLTAPLRYRLVPVSENVNEVQDSKNPSARWVFDNLQPARGNSRDYAIVASYFDPTIEQRVLVAAGIGMTGTVAATEFLTTDKYMKTWLQETKTQNKNVEIVLSTDILDGEPGPPHVIASTTW